MSHYLRSLASARRFATSTAPKMQAYSSSATSTGHELSHHGSSSKTKFKGEYLPVFVAVGMIAVSVALGLVTLKQHLVHSPGVLVSKKRRETVPEVVEPDWAIVKAEDFVNKSLFRRVARLQDFDAVRAGIADPTRQKAMPRKVETLKSVGVDPSGLISNVGLKASKKQ